MLDCIEMAVSLTATTLTTQVFHVAVVVLAFHVLANPIIAGDPRVALPAAPVPASIDDAPLPKVFVSAFRGDAGKTTARLVREDLERGGAFEVVAFESSDAYGVHAEATGGRVEAVVFKPSGRVLFQRRYESPNLRQNVHRLTDDLTEIVTRRPGIASSIIGFVSDAGGDRQVYLCDSDGEDIRRVTIAPAMEAVHPCISLKNNTIVYTSLKNGFADIWTIDLVAEVRRRLINAPGDNRHPVLSPDGGRLAVTMSYTGSTDLYVTTSAGGRSRRLTDDDAIESHPTWSPDGRHIAFEQQFEGGAPQVRYVSSLGGKPDALPTLPATAASGSSHPDWSPDGHAIAFAVESGEHSRIVAFDLNTRKTSTIDGSEGGHSPSWAPDSRHLAFLNQNELWVLDTRSGRRSKIVAGFGNVSEPFWSR